MMERLQKLIAWIRSDWKRFVLEVLTVAFFAFVSWGVTYMLNNRRNLVCMDEKEAMWLKWEQAQAEIDRIEHDRVVAEKNQEIAEKDRQIYDLREKMASDSISHMSELAAMGTINQYVKKGRK